MAIAVCGMSHSPLIGKVDVDPPQEHRVAKAVDRARSFVAEFAPELVVVVAPDHFNGFHYKAMPAYCVGAHAAGVGDYGSSAATLDVPEDRAIELATMALEDGVDVTVSYRMQVDHGFMQPLEVLLGDPTSVPVVPVFVNCAAPPLGPPRRARRVGEVIGRFAARDAQRVLIVASGGLSHDPPVPSLTHSPAPVVERLVGGRPLTEAESAQRVATVARMAMEYGTGDDGLRPLNPEWDNAFLDLIEAGNLDGVDGWSTDWCTEQGGRGGQEVRTWIAAFSALATAGRYRLHSRFYEPMDRWITGFAVATATSVA